MMHFVHGVVVDDAVVLVMIAMIRHVAWQWMWWWC